jgi:hypothetical protein
MKPQHLPPERLHVGPHAVVDRHQHVQREILPREPLPEEPEGPRPRVLPPGVQHPDRPGHVRLHPGYVRLQQPPADLPYRQRLLVAEPHQVVHLEGAAQVTLQHQPRPQLLRLPVARPQHAGDPLGGEARQRRPQVLREHPGEELGGPLGQLVAQQRVHQQPAQLLAEGRVRVRQPAGELAARGPQIRLGVGQQPGDEQRPLEQRGVWQPPQQPRPRPADRLVGARQQVLDQLVGRRRGGQDQRLAAHRLHLRQRVPEQVTDDLLRERPQVGAQVLHQHAARPGRPPLVAGAEGEEPGDHSHQQRPQRRLREPRPLQDLLRGLLHVREAGQQQRGQGGGVLGDQPLVGGEPAERLLAGGRVGAGGHGDQQVQVRVLRTVASGCDLEAQLRRGLVGLPQEHPQHVEVELVAELLAVRQREGGELVDQRAAALVQQVQQPLRSRPPELREGLLAGRPGGLEGALSAAPVEQPVDLLDALAVAVEQLVEGIERGEGAVLDGDRLLLLVAVQAVLVGLARVGVGEGQERPHRHGHEPLVAEPPQRPEHAPDTATEVRPGARAVGPLACGKLLLEPISPAGRREGFLGGLQPVGDPPEHLRVSAEFRRPEQPPDLPEPGRRQRHRAHVAEERRAAHRVADLVEQGDDLVGLGGAAGEVRGEGELEGLRIAVGAERLQLPGERRPERRPELGPSLLVGERQQRLGGGAAYGLRVLLLGVERPQRRDRLVRPAAAQGPHRGGGAGRGGGASQREQRRLRLPEPQQPRGPAQPPGRRVVGPALASGGELEPHKDLPFEALASAGLPRLVGEGRPGRGGPLPRGRRGRGGRGRGGARRRGGGGRCARLDLLVSLAVQLVLEGPLEDALGLRRGDRVHGEGAVVKATVGELLAVVDHEAPGALLAERELQAEVLGPVGFAQLRLLDDPHAGLGAA